MHCLGEEVERSDAALSLLARVLSAMRSLIWEVFGVLPFGVVSHSASGCAAHSGVGFRGEPEKGSSCLQSAQAGNSNVCGSAPAHQMSAGQRQAGNSNVCGSAPGGLIQMSASLGQEEHPDARIQMSAGQRRAEHPEQVSARRHSRCLRSRLRTPRSSAEGSSWRAGCASRAESRSAMFVFPAAPRRPGPNLDVVEQPSLQTASFHRPKQHTL
jgi:hypothetical protein